MALPGLSGIHHVALIVDDYAVSKRFYVEVLGLPVVRETWRAERQSWKLDLALPDGAQLELFTFPGAPQRPSYPEAQGLRHLALRCWDLDEAVAHLGGAGVAVEAIRTDSLTGQRFVFFADPNGLPLELYEESPALVAGELA
ncbi:VOC family protein [Niveibacterium sp. SC-1]|uniref:SMU1112c/YaeR family gloxylase I-like metalloprotein n=1 Tax=Niveibacterium sp. SC-1 TaxID=3135646 RepID=UPI00311DA7DC